MARKEGDNMKNALKLLFISFFVLAQGLTAAQWTYDAATKYMTTADGWKISIGSVTGTELATANNGGMIKGAPETGDMENGYYTLDLSGPIVDSTDSSKYYTLTKIGYYAFNGCPVNIGELILPETLKIWASESQVGVFGRIKPSHYCAVKPDNFTHGLIWSGSNFSLEHQKFDQELHLEGVTYIGGCGLTLTHGNLARIFFYPQLGGMDSTTFANSTAKYDLYFMKDCKVPGGINDTSWLPGARSYLHIPAESEEWSSYLESNARVFTEADLTAFRKNYPDSSVPEYVITAGKFKNGYAVKWNGEPQVVVESLGDIEFESISPRKGVYTKIKTGTKMTFSAPAVSASGQFKCKGCKVEITSTDWSAAEVTEYSDVTSVELEIDSAKSYRVTWLWQAEMANSVTVSSNKGTQFGSCQPAYGVVSDFAGGNMLFSAKEPSYEEEEGKRYVVTGYKLTHNDGSVTLNAGNEFSYDLSMGNVILEWQWELNGYKLATDAPGYLPVEVTPALDANGYVSIGAAVTLVAKDAPQGVFYHWSGDTEGIDTYSRTITVDIGKATRLCATPKCNWYYANNAITNSLGWRIKVSKGSKAISLNSDCIASIPSVAWNTEEGTYLLDLSLPIVDVATGDELDLTSMNSHPFRRTIGYLGKVVLPETLKKLNGNDAAVFAFQEKLREIIPAPFARDFQYPKNAIFNLGVIPYQGDVFILNTNMMVHGNCNIQFTHKGVQNIYFGRHIDNMNSSTIFSWSYANYILHFEGCPSKIASSRNSSGSYSFYVRYPANNIGWSEYLAANARDFAEDDKAAFAAKFPDSQTWPKHTFTNGFFKGTWARAQSIVGTVINIK